MAKNSILVSKVVSFKSIKILKYCKQNIYNNRPFAKVVLTPPNPPLLRGGFYQKHIFPPALNKGGLGGVFKLSQQV